MTIKVQLLLLTIKSFIPALNMWRSMYSLFGIRCCPIHLLFLTFQVCISRLMFSPSPTPFFSTISISSVQTQSPTSTSSPSVWGGGLRITIFLFNYVFTFFIQKFLLYLSSVIHNCLWK